MEPVPQYSWASIASGIAAFFAVYALLQAVLRATLRHVARGGDALEERIEQEVHRVRTINGSHRARG